MHIYIYIYAYIYSDVMETIILITTMAMDGQWWNSRIVCVKSNRVLNKYWARSINILINTEIGS